METDEPCVHAIETIACLRIPTPQDNIYKDECTLCYETQV
jgi:hypothetical protein